MKLLVLVLSFASAYASRPLWYDGDCGISQYADAGVWPPNLDKYIVGGIDSRIHEFPWQVSLRSFQGANGHFCGGNVINEHWVLTAAHCVVGDSPGDFYVLVGEHDSSDAGNEVREYYDVQLIFIHEEYGAASQYDSDIALVKTVQPIVMSDEVRPVCAPDDDDDYESDVAQISGWGALTWGGGCCPAVLQWTEVVTVTNQYCDELISEYLNIPVTDTMICSSDDGEHDERDTCQGDSGGPMTVQNEDGSFSIIGLTSWGYRCAGGTPGVYARVNYFNDWITAKIEEN